MRNPLFWIILVVLLAAAAGVYFWRQQVEQGQRLEPLPVHTAAAPEPRPEASADGSYVKLTQAVDAKKLVAVYVHFYPLFQQAYRELGYPRQRSVGAAAWQRTQVQISLTIVADQPAEPVSYCQSSIALV